MLNRMLFLNSPMMKRGIVTCVELILLEFGESLMLTLDYRLD